MIRLSAPESGSSPNLSQDAAPRVGIKRIFGKLLQPQHEQKMLPEASPLAVQADFVTEADQHVSASEGSSHESESFQASGDGLVAQGADAASLPSTVLGLSAVSPESMASAPTWLIGVVSLVGLGALGGAGAKGASPSPQPSADTESDRAVRVQVALGPVVDTRDLVVTLYKADGSVLAGEGGFGTDNVYEFRPEAAYSGKVFVRIEDRGEIADFMDETTGERKNIGTELWAATEVGGQEHTVLMTVSPLSTVAVIKALNAGHVDNVQTLVSSSQAAQADVIQANKALAALFGLGETDLARQAVQFTIDTVGQVSSAFNPYGVALTVISNFRVDPKAAIADLSAHISINNTGVANMLQGPVSDDLRRAAAAPQVAGTEIAAMGAMVDMAAVADTQAPSFGAMGVLNVVMTDGGTTVGTAWASDNFGVSRYQISGGEHAALFEINSRSGALAFKANPDFGALANTADTSSYHINITAHDAAGNSAESALSLRVIEGNHIMTTAKKVFFFKQWGPDAAHAASATAAWYTGLGVTGVTSSTLGLVKERTAAVWAGAANADTAAANVQALANAAAKLMRLANGSLADDRRNDLLESDLRALGIVTNHVGLFNSYLGASNQVAVNTVAKMQTMATAVDRLATAIASGSVGSLTVDDVAALNIRTGLGLDVLVHALKGNSAEATTAAAVQAIALKAAQAMAVVAAYANNDGNNLGDFPAPTVQTLRDLGFDGASDVQLNGLLAHLRSADVGSANVSRMSDIAVIYERVISANHHTPVFESGDNGSVEENADASAVIYTAQASDADTNAANNTVRYSLKAGVGDAVLLSIDAVTGEVRLLISADYETKASYTFTVVASDNGSPAKSAEKVVTVSVTDVRHTSEQVFEQWQAAATTTEALQGIAKEVVQQRDTVTRDGSGNQASDVLRLDQWVDGVTGTDIVSEQELNQGFVITGRASPGETAIRWRLDNDRTDGINGQDAVELQVGDNDVNSDGRNDVTVTYNNSNGEWSMAFVANSAALKQATPGTAGSGVHQLVVDANGDGALNNGEASRLFLVAAGTAATPQSGATQHNYSAQDVITGNVFVYYHGDPDGAGTALWTALDGDETPGAEGDWTDQDGDYLDEDFYASDASTELTPGNLAARMRTPVDAQVWEFHAATLQREVQGWAQANALAQNHQLTGSNTGRLASLQEMMALYAANFGGDDAGSMSHATALTPGDVQVMDAELSFSGQWADANDNTPAQWMQRFPESAALYWTAAPSPMGYASVSLSSGQAVDSHSDDTRQMMVVLAGGQPVALPAPVVPPVDPNDSTPPAALTLVAPSIDGLSALPNTTVARKFAIGNLENGATWYYKLGNGDWKQGVGQSFSVPDGEYGANHTVSVKQRDAAGNEGEVTVFSGNLTVASSKLELLNSWLSKIQSLASGGRERFVMVDGELTVLHTFLAEGNTTGHHTFTASGNMTVDYFVLGGGGGGGGGSSLTGVVGGGGSAGALLTQMGYQVSNGDYSVVVGAGGAGGYRSGNVAVAAIAGGVSSAFGNSAEGGSAGALNTHVGGNGAGGTAEGSTDPTVARLPGAFVTNAFTGFDRMYAEGGSGGMGSWGSNPFGPRVLATLGGDSTGRDTSQIYEEIWVNEVSPVLGTTSAAGTTGSGGAGASIDAGSHGGSGLVMVRYDAQVNEARLLELLKEVYTGPASDLTLANLPAILRALANIQGDWTLESLDQAIAAQSIDTQAPQVSLDGGFATQGTATVTVRSNEAGKGYLVKTEGYFDGMASYGALTVTDEHSILSAPQSKWKAVDLQANTDATISLQGLEQGSYAFYAVDRAGNLSDRSTEVFTLDTDRPTVSINHGGLTLLSGQNDNISAAFNESATVYVVHSSINVQSSVDITGAPDNMWNSNGMFNGAYNTGGGQISLTGLIDGRYSLYAVDWAGNLSSPSSTSMNVDGTGPSGATISPDVRQSKGVVAVQSSEAGTAYLVKTGGEGAVIVHNRASITGAADSKFNAVAVTFGNSDVAMPLDGLEDGTYQLFTADAVGNLSIGTSNTLTIDNTAPVATLTAGSFYRTDTVIVESSETGTAYLIKTGGAGAVTVTDVASIINAGAGKFKSMSIGNANAHTPFVLSGLENGTYTLYTSDEAGNLSEPSLHTLDIVTAPGRLDPLGLTMPIDDGLSSHDGVTTNNTATISGLIDGATWEYKIGTADWTTGTGSSFTLPLGHYNTSNLVQVRQSKDGQSSDPIGSATSVRVVTAIEEMKAWMAYADSKTAGGGESFVLSSSGELMRLHQFTQVGGGQALLNSSGTALDVEYLVVGGGGAGGAARRSAGGGGGGGVVAMGTASLGNDAAWTVTVGNGGVSKDGLTVGNGSNGGSSVLGDVTALGGGAGGVFISANPGAGRAGNTAGTGGGASSGRIWDVTTTVAHSTVTVVAGGGSTANAGAGGQGGVHTETGNTFHTAGGGGGNAVSTNITNTSEVDTRAPVLVLGEVSADGRTVTLAYDEALSTASTPDVADFRARTSSGTNSWTGYVNPTSVSVSGNLVTLTFATAWSKTQRVELSYTPGVNPLQDTASQSAATFATNMRHIPATGTEAFMPQLLATSAKDKDVFLYFSEHMRTTELPLSTDFAVTVKGQQTTVTGISVMGSVVKLTLELSENISPGDAVTVGYKDPSSANDATGVLQDVAGNDWTGFGTGAAASAMYAGKGGDGVASDITGAVVYYGGGGGGGADGLGVSAGQGGLGGGGAGGKAFERVGNFHQTAELVNPTIVGRETNTAGTKILLHMSEAINANHLPEAHAFLVTVAGISRNVSGVGVVNRTTIELTLDGSAVISGQSITVAYSPNGGNGVQDLSGNALANSTATTVLNRAGTYTDTVAPVLQNLFVDNSGDRSKIVMVYNEWLDTSVSPAAMDVPVWVQGQSRPVADVNIQGATVVLTLEGSKIDIGALFSLDYTDPAGNNISGVIQDIKGNDAATLGTTAGALYNLLGAASIDGGNGLGGGGGGVYNFSIDNMRAGLGGSGAVLARFELGVDEMDLLNAVKSIYTGDDTRLVSSGLASYLNAMEPLIHEGHTDVDLLSAAITAIL